MEGREKESAETRTQKRMVWPWMVISVELTSWLVATAAPETIEGGGRVSWVSRWMMRNFELCMVRGTDSIIDRFRKIQKPFIPFYHFRGSEFPIADTTEFCVSGHSWLLRDDVCFYGREGGMRGGRWRH